MGAPLNQSLVDPHNAIKFGRRTDPIRIRPIGAEDRVTLEVQNAGTLDTNTLISPPCVTVIFAVICAVSLPRVPASVAALLATPA